ncbi:hypothetical protein Skr01_19730 [Sphaerisporangium krabiense]|nr:hypothetical protein Skr01_19730 [Sphaerisporangium krabiense]
MYVVVVMVMNVALIAGALRTSRPAPVVHRLAPVKMVAAGGASNRAFLQGDALAKIFEDGGLDLQMTEGFGSGEIADSQNLVTYDIAFPAGIATAQQVRRKLLDDVRYQAPQISVYSTPLVVLTWRPLLPLLEELRVAVADADGAWRFDVEKYLDVVRAGVRWDKIAGNRFYDNPNRVLLTVPDPAQANLGKMFLASAGYALNRRNVVADEKQAGSVAGKIAPAFRELGQLLPSADRVFTAYQTNLINGAPMVLAYESDYIGARLAKPPRLPDDAVMMYLTPAVMSENILVPVNAKGTTAAAARLFTSDAVQRLAENVYGFRCARFDFATDMRAHRLTVPAKLFPVPLPEASVMKELVDAVKAKRAD